MAKMVTTSFLVFLLFLLSGCELSDQSHRITQHPPRLMKTGEHKTGLVAYRHPSRNMSNDPYRLKELELRHQERLAAIEAEKAKALKQLELERLQRSEEIIRRTKEIEAQSAMKVEEERRKTAELLAQKERELKAMEANVSLHRDATQMNINRLQNENRIQVEKIKGKYSQMIAQLDKELKSRYLWAFLAAAALLMLFIWLFTRYKKNLEAKEREEERRHQAWMEERRQQHEKATKILEIIASSETDKEVKVELTRLLQQEIANPDDPKLIEYKGGKEEEKEK